MAKGKKKSSLKEPEKPAQGEPKQAPAATPPLPAATANPAPAEPKATPVPVPATEYEAFVVLKKPGTGGLCVMRRVQIKDGQILQVTDNVEDLFSLQLSKVVTEIETSIQ